MMSQQEREERALRKAEMEAQKAANMMEYEDEIQVCFCPVQQVIIGEQASMLTDLCLSQLRLWMVEYMFMTAKTVPLWRTHRDCGTAW